MSITYLLGPAEPVELDTFLEPMISELLRLHDGVPTYDAYRHENFLLRNHLVLVTGDSPAIAKILHLTGHNGYSPCRFCIIKGTPFQKKYKVKDVERLKTTYYYLFTPPTDIPPSYRISDVHDVYDPLHLPCCTNTGFINDTTKAEEDDSGQVAKETGIKRRSILFRIPSIQFPYSFSIDIMHLIYLGLTRDLVILLNDSYFSGTGASRDTSQPYCIQEKV